MGQAFLPVDAGYIAENRTGRNACPTEKPFKRRFFSSLLGGAAGIAEMLLQSHAGEIHLLPALPDAWPAGSVRDLCARGAFEVSLPWSGGELLSTELRSKGGQPCVVRYRDHTVALKTERGKTIRLDGINLWQNSGQDLR